MPCRRVLCPVSPDPDADTWTQVRQHHAMRATATALVRPDQVVTGPSAAILHGLPTMSVPTVPVLTARRPRTQGRHGRALVRGAALQPDDITDWFGAPVTTLARTVIDIARNDRRGGLIAADAALHEQVVAERDLIRMLARAKGWPGVRRAREVFALADPRAESPLESLVRLELHDDGFPPPELQVEIGRYRVDMAWPAQRVILEADGRLKYSDDALWREKQREHQLTRLGYRVVRVLWSDVLQDWAATRTLLRRLLTSPLV